MNLIRFEIQAGSLSLACMLINARLHSDHFILSNILEPRKLGQDPNEQGHFGVTNVLSHRT